MEENCAAAGGMETGDAIGAEMTGEAEAAFEPAEEMGPKERSAEDADRLRRDETEEVLRLRNEREQTARERARLVAEEQIRQIGQLDGDIRSVDDLMAMPDYEGFYALVKKGISMVEAYKLTRYDELMKRTADASARQTMRSLGSRRHLTAVAGQPGSGEYVSVPADVAAEFRLAKPGITDDEIRRKYKKFQKYQRQ